MPMIDIKARNEAEIKKIISKITAHIKGMKYAELADHGWTGRNTYMIQVNSPYQMCDELAYIVNRSDNAVVVDMKDHEGSFDWASETYCKDCSTVEFKF